MIASSSLRIQPSTSGLGTYRHEVSLPVADEPAAGEQPETSIVLTYRRYPDRVPGQDRAEAELTCSFANPPAQQGFDSYTFDRRERLRQGQQWLDAMHALLELMYHYQTTLRTCLHQQVRLYGWGAQCYYPASGRRYLLGDVSEGARTDALGEITYHATVLAPASEAGQQLLLTQAELEASEHLGLMEFIEPLDEPAAVANVAPVPLAVVAPVRVALAA